MLFYSFEFLYAFLPTVLLGFYALGRLPESFRNLSLFWLMASSLFFYGWWELRYLLLIGASIVFNYAVGLYLHRTRQRLVVIAAVALNILLIAYYKYLGFFAEVFDALAGGNIQIGEIILPLAISFFTLQQIAWLVDNFSGSVEQGKVSFGEYLLFVVFFPQLIAGPIVHHAEMIPQFRDNMLRRFQTENFAAGITMFIIGLFKKVVLADNLAPAANVVFDGAAWGHAYTAYESWLGAVGYSLQLYFEFSGYADMAIGLGLMFNIRLPVNFDSPYKACSLREFWRRWHMTLSRFLRGYIYSPLGGNRKGDPKMYLFMFITLLLGGIWYGAGWTFIIWGAIHAVLLIINLLWRRLSPWKFVPPLACLITLLVSVIAQVMLRAHDFDSALLVYSSMFGIGNVVSASADIPLLTLLLIAATLVFVVTLPNTQQLMRHKYKPADHDCNKTSADDAWYFDKLQTLHIEWNFKWLLYLAVLAGISLYTLLDASVVRDVIYFQF
jgi:alginate O-acetyltransferase complex protein AlgI